MILHDQLEKRRLERSTSENGADIRRPMISSLHHTSITPPGWVKPLATMISGSITRSACFPSKQTSASLGVCHWYCDTNCHGSLHIYIRILACVHVHYRGWQSIFTAIWSPRIWRVSRSSYRPRSNRYTRSKLQRVPLRWWTATIRGRSITYRRTGNFALDRINKSPCPSEFISCYHICVTHLLIRTWGAPGNAVTYFMRWATTSDLVVLILSSVQITWRSIVVKCFKKCVLYIKCIYAVYI